MRPAIGRAGAGQHMHQRRLAGAVMADQADAFAGRDDEIDAIERTDGAEMLFDAVQLDDWSPAFSHAGQRSDRSTAGAPQMRITSCSLQMAAMASSWVYSMLATPPTGILGRWLSKSSWVKAR